MFSSRSLVSRSILTLLVLAAPTVAQAPDAYQPRTLTLAEVAQDIALLRQALEQIHAGYDRYAPRRVMDAAFARLDRRAATPMTDLELYREVSLLLAWIRCNHIKAEYPTALERWREQHATHLPVRVRVFGKRMFVAESAANNIARGTEITSINGVSAPDIVTKLSRYVAVDGFTDFARAALLERDGDLMVPTSTITGRWSSASPANGSSPSRTRRVPSASLRCRRSRTPRGKRWLVRPRGSISATVLPGGCSTAVRRY